MALLSACREVQVLAASNTATCSVYDQGSIGPASVELDVDLKGHDNLAFGMAQVLSAATKRLPRFYADRMWTHDTKVEEAHNEGSRCPEDMHRHDVHALAEATRHDEEIAVERSMRSLGLLDVCLPGSPKQSDRLGAGCCLGETLHESIDVDILREERLEEKLYFERLAAASRLAREEELRQQAEEQERERLEEELATASQRRRAARERVRKDREKLAAYLKKHGFNGPKTKRKKLFAFWYPLHVAVEENNPEMVQLLLRAGADRGQRNSHGMTPFASAMKRNKNSSHEAVLQLLRVGGPTVPPTMSSAADRPRVSAVKSKHAACAAA